ncbi:MAG: DUF3379 family protein [Gammaproteobacteria bacterium]|nr:DUF3379 domain-containing protein [Gammaproteobacteria bacterium]NNC98127.1 DUF3379 family protein [Gammaproteobacteria bacterium]NNM14007.1 DUF3379 family protein [Gammaproteobacteria bacterium]
MIENIDCISFKRNCGAEPQQVETNPKLFAHQQECVACADYYAASLSLEGKLLSALSLPITQNSIDHQLSKVIAAKNERRPGSLIKQKFRPWLAAAASIMLAITALFAMQYPGTAIASEVVEHIHHEPNLLVLTHTVTPREQVDMVLKQANIMLNDQSIEILSASLCPFAGQLAAHIVVKGESGRPVTILIMPEMRTRAAKIKSKEFNGRILPAEHGAIAVIGGKKENPDYMDRVLLEAFHWQD